MKLGADPHSGLLQKHGGEFWPLSYVNINYLLYRLLCVNETVIDHFECYTLGL